VKGGGSSKSQLHTTLFDLVGGGGECMAYVVLCR
jgi:hypothetical protein